MPQNNRAVLLPRYAALGTFPAMIAGGCYRDKGPLALIGVEYAEAEYYCLTCGRRTIVTNKILEAGFNAKTKRPDERN